ncbi:RNA polymerase sigma factor [Nocardia sp.]|uniref:RNA polymerase sigma factor n=1 Tax=Nocardia sp. TaxID=1821 RepID=UPI0026026B16|nr:sigma-70 family RNA polymerase sigma factor [Nocardia sp.]
MDEPDRITADLRLPERLIAAPVWQEEFIEFYRKSVPRLVGFLILQGARRADAAEIVQETMTKAWNSWSTINLPMAWARKTASRVWLRRIASLEEDLIGEFPENSALCSRTSDIDEWIARDHYYRVVSGLPPRQRQVMVWAMEGCAAAEIAELLQISQATVRSHLRKARRTIAIKLEEGGRL